jgi:hypothetical protein
MTHVVLPYIVREVDEHERFTGGMSLIVGQMTISTPLMTQAGIVMIITGSVDPGSCE